MAKGVHMHDCTLFIFQCGTFQRFGSITMCCLLVCLEVDIALHIMRPSSNTSDLYLYMCVPQDMYHTTRWQMPIHSFIKQSRVVSTLT